ncbi:MAG: TRAP transporter large permease [Alphaproteobacteria bacterium]|jgi:C4-dicarboxylate transporter DctM subunit|nr:TRAP transporter large permease [Alphaproteobacteria bacterium]MDP6517109.1 TRAP transporter large permease [Alphaproteobacteria bacterium]
MTLTLVLAGLFALLLLGVDIAFAMAGLGIAMLLAASFSPLLIPQALMSSMDNFILLSVPLFILMADVLLRGGAGEDLFGAVHSWIGHWPGGLAVATILSCAIFASISGSSVATAATIGTVAIPAMVARGYERRFVYGLLAAGGTIGILIPPSIPMIVFGFVISESIIDLFLAGIGPGLLLTAVFIVYAVLRARLGGGHEPSPKASWAERRRATARAAPSLGLAALIVFGIYFGAFTPTEAAGVGFVAALVITLLIRRTLTLGQLPAIALASTKTSVMVLFIIAGAKIFGHAVTLYQIPQDVTALVVGSLTGPIGFIAAICALLLVMGCVLETLSMMLLMLPIIHPSLASLGIDPIWFGVLFTMMIECALITPPVGLNLFVIQAVAREGGESGDSRPAAIGDVVHGVLPFVGLILLCLVVVVLVPDIALYIPFKL